MPFLLMILTTVSLCFSINSIASSHKQEVTLRLKGEKQFQEVLDLSQMKKAIVRKNAHDPFIGQRASFQGVLLKSVVDYFSSKVSSEQNAAVDYLLIEGENHQLLLIPRAFGVKNDILLSFSRDASEVSPSLFPVKEKISGDFVAHKAIAVKSVKSIEFVHSKDFFGKIALESRTDPVALRGERWFIQNCLTCHGSRGQEVTHSFLLKTSALSVFQHPVVPGFEKLSSKDERALLTFFEKIRGQLAKSTEVSK